MAHVAKPVTSPHLIRRSGETLSRGPKQPDDILGHVPHRDRGRRVCYEALVDELLGETVELPSRHAWPHVLFEHFQASRGYPSTLTHRLELRRALADDQASSSLPTALRICSVTFGISCSASTVTRRSRSA